MRRQSSNVLRWNAVSSMSYSEDGASGRLRLRDAPIARNAAPTPMKAAEWYMKPRIRKVIPTANQTSRVFVAAEHRFQSPPTLLVYALITSLGQVGAGSKGITSANITAKAFGEYCITGLGFTPRVAIAQPDILSNKGFTAMVAEVQTPNDGTGSCPPSDQVYVRIAHEDITGAQGSEHIVRVGQQHDFYIAIN